ncbi:Kinesin-like protein KIN-12C [Camellia lanceoleosa]|uniref:Kinesin-like protein KIN-12C n=1 Tax=Camellia lanceoleosa TaxID=1840588 RepID=A0ACC0HEA3_9ERIC|nr:Kinesin-like protein KIN-12C [Camellia lanceoleosa]
MITDDLQVIPGSTAACISLFRKLGIKDGNEVEERTVEIGAKEDSLGGNSKTTIIANVSPSICSANGTLSTLKFAQRAKLIQNNAKINEDASGNVTALQRQIQQLQGQLSFLMKHYDISRSVPSYQQSRLADSSEEYESSGERNTCDNHNTRSIPKRKAQQREEDAQRAKMVLSQSQSQA